MARDMHTRKIIKMLLDAGWEEVSTDGDHVNFKHPDKAEICTVPHPNRDLPIGTLKNIEKVSGLLLRKLPVKKKTAQEEKGL